MCVVCMYIYMCVCVCVCDICVCLHPTTLLFAAKVANVFGLTCIPMEKECSKFQ